MDPDGNSGGTAEGGEGEKGGGGAGWCCAYMYVIDLHEWYFSKYEVLSPDPLLLCTPRDENQLEQNKLEAPILLSQNWL